MTSAFSECRRCYNHIGGRLAVYYFSYLINNSYISYASHNECIYTHHRTPLILNPRGISYFEFLEYPLKTHNFAFSCLDGTEKKPHLAGKIGNILYLYFINNGLLHRNNNSRILGYTTHAKNILSGKTDQKIHI